MTWRKSTDQSIIFVLINSLPEMKIAYFFILITLTVFCSSCYNQRPNIECGTFEEAADPAQLNEEEWNATGRGLHASFGSKDIKYAKSEVPMQAVTKDMNATVWQGECVSFQAVLWSAYEVNQVECVWSDLVSENNDTIPASVINTGFVRYALSDVGFISNEADEISWRDSCLMPDMLDYLPCKNMQAKTVSPLWVTVEVPHGAKPGAYKTRLKIYSKKNPPQELRLTLKILNRQLPSPEKWHFETNFRINPKVIAVNNHVELWSDKHYYLMQPFFKHLKRAGQKKVSIDLFNYSQNGKALNAPLIKWCRTKKGVIKGNYEHFDKWIAEHAKMKMNRQIDVYTFYPELKNSIDIFEEKTGETVTHDLTVNDSKLIEACLKDVVNYLDNKGVLSKSVIAIGKGNPDEIAYLKSIIQKVDADLKLELVASEWAEGMMKDIYAVNVASQYTNLKEWFKIRHQEGQETSYFLAPDTDVPNVHIYSKPAEATFFGWYMAAQGIDGLHCDQFNNWPSEQVYIDAREQHTSSGSSFLIYPSGRSSIRYERLLEGIQDYEKLFILRNELSTKENEEATAFINQIDEVLSDFVIDRLPREKAETMVANGQQLLEEIALKFEN